MRDVPVQDLVLAAGRGDQAAWAELVRRYAGTVWAVARSFRLSAQDAEDVSQTAWLLLAVHLPTLKEPAAVGGWLATTTRRESIRLLNRRARELPADPLDPVSDSADGTAPGAEEILLRTELREAVRSAFARLPDRCRRLLAMLTLDPPPPYSQISDELGIPHGGIGPTRARCLDRLRKLLRS